MLLATGSAFDFVKFIQILCWIILPVLLLAVLLTVFLHFRKKKFEKAEAENEDEEFMNASPELLGYTKGDGEYVFFDHSSLISEYKKRLSYNHARYTALHHDFEKLETKYAMLASYATTELINKKNSNMENVQDSMPQNMETEINKMTEDYTAEKKELLTRLEQMRNSYQNLEHEHELLLERVHTGTMTEGERSRFIEHWKQEKMALKDKVAEQEYLKEVIEEKKAQIDFLQNQLEQRIKNNHQSESQRKQLLSDLEQVRNANENTLLQLNSLKNDLVQQQEETNKLQIVLNGKEEQFVERQQLLTSKLDHITWLENTLHEVKQQNEILNASVADSKDLVAVLQEQLTYEQQKSQAMEQKLSSNKQTLQRLYKDFSAIMGENDEQSPVIALRPDYISRENEEVEAAAQ
jgi:ABC-type Na+ efflux pump permease subunit